jgi:hypothetical protein
MLVPEEDRLPDRRIVPLATGSVIGGTGLRFRRRDCECRS